MAGLFPTDGTPLMVATRPPQAIRWPPPPRRPITRVGSSMSWGDRILVALGLTAAAGAVAGGLILAGALVYLGWILGSEVLRLLGVGR